MVELFWHRLEESMLDVRDQRGIAGALIDLEYQRMELIKFNLFDNKTFAQYAGSPTGPVLKKWNEMRLPSRRIRASPASAAMDRSAATET